MSGTETQSSGHCEDSEAAEGTGGAGVLGATGAALKTSFQTRRLGDRALIR